MFHEGTTCSARHFRTLPVTPVVGPRLALANGLLLLATSRSCADFRPYLEGGSLPEGTYHPLAVRPANGYPSLALLPNDPARQRMLRMVLSSPIPVYKHSPPGAPPKLSQNGPKSGSGKSGKKGLKLSRLGELLNTQKNVHFFALPGRPGRGNPPGAPKTPPKWAHSGGVLNTVFS